MFVKPVIAIIIVAMLFNSCDNQGKANEEVLATYKYLPPDFSQVGIRLTSDTIHFALDPDTYNSIRSFNAFSQGGIQYISFYDQRSQSINIYNLKARSLFKRITLKDIFAGRRFYKTNVFCRNFDSIFVNNMLSIYLMDSTPRVKDSLAFRTSPEFAWSNIENTLPLVIKDGIIFTAVYPYADEKSLDALQNWRVLYKFDFNENKSELIYHLPVFLQKNYYGHRFMNHSHCIDNSGNFVISFPADTLLYKTDLKGKHFSYYARSKFQQEDITPLSRQALLDDEGGKNYLMRNSYEAIYFDAYKKRYLRLAKSRISESDYLSGNKTRKQSLIIFDENLKIIGESEFDTSISLKELFFTEDGRIYARIANKDEYAVHFAKLEYSE